MIYYFGLGGFGCKTLHMLAHAMQIAPEQCYYMDASYDIRSYSEADGHIFAAPNINHGTSATPAIGRSLLWSAMVNGQEHFNSFISKFHPDEQDSVIYILSSCGGFGSGAVWEMVNFAAARFWNEHHRNGLQQRIIAFHEKIVCPFSPLPKYLGFLPNNTALMISQAGINTELPKTEQLSALSWLPYYSFYLIDRVDLDRFATREEAILDVLTASEQELSKRNAKQKYLKKLPRKTAPVFISYSSADLPVVEGIEQALSERGLSCWYAKRDIRTGSYPSAILQAIRGAKVCIIVVSENSLNSDHVKNEIDIAFSLQKQGMLLIPFLIDDSELNDEFRYYLCRQQFTFGTVPPLAARIADLIDRVAETFE